MRNNQHWRAQRFYRDPQHGKLMGVCAGLADDFGWNVTATRILAIMALLWFNVSAMAAYVALGFLLPTKPETLCAEDIDDEYGRSMRRSTSDTLHDVRHCFRELDMKLQHMEGYVTSNRYDLDRQFRDLEY